MALSAHRQEEIKVGPTGIRIIMGTMTTTGAPLVSKFAIGVLQVPNVLKWRGRSSLELQVPFLLLPPFQQVPVEIATLPIRAPI